MVQVIEYYVGFSSSSSGGSWSTNYIDMPACTPQTPEEFLDAWMSAHVNDFEDVVAFWGIYNIREKEDDEDE